MPDKLTFGYLCDFRNPPPWDRPWSDVYAETLDFIAWSETAGFEAAWVPEHHQAADGYLPSPLIALTAIAARTKRMKIGTSIALAPLHHPVRFAEDCAVLDVLADGRLELALGIGYRKCEYDSYGVDFRKRGSRFDEFLQIVRPLWAGETVTFEGEHFSVKDAAIMPRPPRGHIPLYVGGFADRALDRAAKYGDGYFGNEEVVDQYIEKLRIHGKDASAPHVRLQGLFVLVARDPDKALHELAPYYHYVNNTYAGWLNEERASGVADDVVLKPMSLEEYKASGALQILTPEEAIATFSELQSRVPVEHFMLMLPPGLPPSKFVEYAETFAKEVIPAFN